MSDRYRLTLVGGPNCGTALLEEVKTWPPPEYLYVKGIPGHYFRTRISLQGMEELDFRSARYEWQQS